MLMLQVSDNLIPNKYQRPVHRHPLTRREKEYSYLGPDGENSFSENEYVLMVVGRSAYAKAMADERGQQRRCV